MTTVASSAQSYRGERLQSIIDSVVPTINGTLEKTSRPKILQSARDTIQRFEREYLSGKFHDTEAIKTHERIINTLKLVSDAFAQNDTEWKQVELAEEVLDKKILDFKRLLIKHDQQIQEHVQEHKQIKAHVQTLNKEIDSLVNLSSVQSKFDYIHTLEQNKGRMESEIEEKKKYEMFMLQCAEKHFNISGEREIRELIHKYYSLTQNYEEWNLSFVKMSEDFQLQRIESESEKRNLMTSILEQQRKLLKLPDLDNIRTSMADLQSASLDAKLRVNTDETDLLSLKNAVESLCSYLSVFKSRDSKATKTFVGQLESVENFCTDTKDVLRRLEVTNRAVNRK